MSDIEWSPWFKGAHLEAMPDGTNMQNDGTGNYRIPMPDYKRITGMPEWSEAPEWAQCLAQDESGKWWFYDHRPEINNPCDCWDIINDDAECRAAQSGTVLGDWRDTLQKRPRDQLDSHPNSEPDADQYSVGADTFPQDARDELLKRAQERNLNPYDAPGFLEAALGHMEDRKTTYDAPEGERSMGKTVVAFNAITGRDLSEEEGWLFMVLLKAVRTQQGVFRADNYEDGAAYFALQGEAAARDRGHE